MAGTGIHYTEGMTGPGKVISHPAHHRGFRIGKVYCHGAAYSGTHLIHKAGRLAVIYVLGVLAYLCYLNGGKPAPAAEAV